MSSDQQIHLMRDQDAQNWALLMLLQDLQTDCVDTSASRIYKGMMLSGQYGNILKTADRNREGV